MRPAAFATPEEAEAQSVKIANTGVAPLTMPILNIVLHPGAMLGQLRRRFDALQKCIGQKEQLARAII